MKATNTLKLLRGLVMSGQRDPASLTKMVTCFTALERELAEEKANTSFDVQKMMALEAQVEALEEELKLAQGTALRAESELLNANAQLTKANKELATANRKIAKLEKASENVSE